MPYVYALDIEMLKIKENTFILGLSHTSFSHEIYNWDKYEYIHMYNTWFGKVGTVKLSKATNSVSIVTSISQFSHSVVSASLWPHESQHTRPPCPSPTPRVYSAHVHWVGDAIQPSHLLLSPSPPAPNPSQHQDLFQWVSSSHQVAKVLEFQLQHQSLQWTARIDLL